MSAARHGTHLYLRYRRRFPDQFADFGVQIKDLLQLGLGNTAHGQRRRERSPRALAGIEASVSVQVKKEKRIVDKGQGEGSGSLTLANLSKASTARHQRQICLAESEAELSKLSRLQKALLKKGLEVGSASCEGA